MIDQESLVTRNTMKHVWGKLWSITHEDSQTWKRQASAGKSANVLKCKGFCRRVPSSLVAYFFVKQEKDWRKRGLESDPWIEIVFQSCVCRSFGSFISLYPLVFLSSVIGLVFSLGYDSLYKREKQQSWPCNDRAQNHSSQVHSDKEIERREKDLIILKLSVCITSCLSWKRKKGKGLQILCNNGKQIPPAIQTLHHFPGDFI